MWMTLALIPPGDHEEGTPAAVINTLLVNPQGAHKKYENMVLIYYEGRDST